jgi:hypothetical protein
MAAAVLAPLERFAGERNERLQRLRTLLDEGPRGLQPFNPNSPALIRRKSPPH